MEGKEKVLVTTQTYIIISFQGPQNNLFSQVLTSLSN